MSSASLGTTIVERIADRESVDPLDLDQRLYDVVDVEALEEVVNSTNGDSPERDVTVSFTFNGYIVTVESGGEVSISDCEPISGPSSQTEASGD